ncbi:MAG: PAS domain-containing sensor histidine kinase, partial [Bacteroidetes bacterium]
NIQAEKISGYKISDWIGKSFIPLIHPEDLPKIQKIFLETLRGKPHSYEVRIFGSNHEIIILSVNTVPIYKDNFVTGTSSYGRDITRQRQAEETLKINEALFHELYDNMKSGSAIFRVINDGSKGSDYIIKKINRTGLKMEGKTLEEVVDKKLIDIRPTIDSFGLIPVMKKVWETGKSAFLPAGIYTDERYSNYYENYVFKLTTGEVVTLYDDVTERKRAGENIKEMKESLEKLNQRLNEIRENERAMISREIHDQLGQSMTALKIDLNWLCGKIAGESEEGAKLNEMIELVTATSRDIQRISSELRPAILDDLGLPAALEWYCEEFAKRTRLQIQMEIDDVQAENINKNLAIYRVLQESLTNIIRHAGAKRVLVKLCKIKKDIVLLIQDDGIGIPADKIRSSKSLGLLGMFERVKQYNGYMEITTPAKRGTSVRISISEK